MNSFSFSRLALITLCSTAMLTACNEKPVSVKKAEKSSVMTVEQLAQKIAKENIIIDTHIDVPYRLEHEYEDVSKATAKGDFDYPRAVKGGLDAPFMSIYIPSKLQKTGGSKVLADKLIDDVEKIVQQSPDKFALAYSTTQVKDNFSKGLISLPMGMENGSPIEGDLANLQHFYDRGIRYITLAHAKTNHISDSSYDENRPAQGLTDFGKNLIVGMNDIGVMVDISHVSDQAFYQVMEISKVPVIASHSSARFFTPDFERNMSDDMIKLLAKNGGVIQMTFSGIFTSKKFREQSAAYKLVEADFIKVNNLDEELEADKTKIDAFEDTYELEQPYDAGTLALVLDHFEHVINLVGIDHVGIGSDFDGVDGILPETLKDVASYPNLIAGLLERGYTEPEIKKLLSGNLMRVWQQVEEYAASYKSQL
jgi:membrane dipeptidase